MRLMGTLLSLKKSRGESPECRNAQQVPVLWMARQNALRHGILRSELLIKDGMNTEGAEEFNELSVALQEDLVPEGALEGMFVEKIAVCYWRLQRILRCEAGM